LMLEMDSTHIKRKTDIDRHISCVPWSVNFQPRTARPCAQVMSNPVDVAKTRLMNQRSEEGKPLWLARKFEVKSDRCVEGWLGSALDIEPSRHTGTNAEFVKNHVVLKNTISICLGGKIELQCRNRRRVFCSLKFGGTPKYVACPLVPPWLFAFEGTGWFSLQN
jgi:hypothetical protein